jgi:hypothetical protein
MLKSEPPEMVPLTDIEVHQIFKEFHEHLIDDAYLLKISSHLKIDAVHLLLQLHPVYCVVRKKQITCIAGIRTLNIASQLFTRDAKIPVHFMKLNDVQIARYCHADILISPLALSFDDRGYANIDALLDKLGAVSEALTDLATCTKVALAKAYGLSRGSLYANERKKRQSG